MYKLIGVFCILAGCAGWGNTKAAMEKERVRHLRTLFHILGQMRGEVSYGKHTLPEICLLLSELNDDRYKTCFSRIYEQTREENGGDFLKVWEMEMGNCLEGLLLREDERETMTGLPKTLNFREEGGQSERIGLAEAFLEGRYRQAEETYENRSKMIRSVSILTGLLLAMILL